MHKIDRPTLVQRFWRSQCEDFVPAVVVCPYGENSSSADSKYGAAFCDSTSILAVAESGKASESRIVGIAKPQPAGRQ